VNLKTPPGKQVNSVSSSVKICAVFAYGTCIHDIHHSRHFLTRSRRYSAIPTRVHSSNPRKVRDARFVSEY
jgi:hypothetical protein